MKWAIVLLLLAGSAPAQACPPPPPGYQPPSAEESLRRRVAGAPNIVYAVVESSVQREGSVLTRLMPGSVRIIHVYKGSLRPGQRIPLYGVSFESDCGNVHFSRGDARQGAYGILLLEAWNGRDALPFVSFEDSTTVAEMMRLELIQSARTATTTR
jgi:hypothetical protein